MTRVDTANRLQGAGFDITIVLHPLLGGLASLPSAWRLATCGYWPPATAMAASLPVPG
jgi:hypothetical protein